MSRTDPGTIPVLDASQLRGTPAARRAFVDQLWEACRRIGCFHLVNHTLPDALCDEVMRVSRDFFALPSKDKAPLDIFGSPHFRGYSEMKNERDWREQIHFGREEPAAGEEVARHPGLALQGPNLWPANEGFGQGFGQGFRRTVLAFLREAETVGHALLGAMAEALHLPDDPFAARLAREPYLLMKLICYHPQRAGAEVQRGVAAHCDYSWLTLLLQDELGGLEAQLSTGEWVDAVPRPGGLFVNLGELMQLATCNAFVATPHRVTNRSFERARLSIPIFMNPNLRTRIDPLPVPRELTRAPGALPRPPGHVHRVIAPKDLPSPDRPMTPFVFGDGEWKRKGLGIWCDECCAGLQRPTTPAMG